MPKRTKIAAAQARADRVCRVMPEWFVHTIRDDGTIMFRIEGKKAATFIEFHAEHWAAFDALNK
jgi:hypothetical protein